MRIHGITVETNDLHSELAGLCGDFKIWYKFPAHMSLSPRADAFVAASLIPSMQLGEDIEIDEQFEISPKLLAGCEELQNIFLLWGKYFGKNFRRIKITGGRLSEATGSNKNTVSFFSGGADGTYTFLKHKAEIDYLLFAKGIDMQLSNDENYTYALNKNQEYLSKYGKKLYPFETNVRYFGHEFGLSWNICFGGGLSSIALAGQISTCLIASGLSYQDMYPHGSSFISDHLWSNEFTQIIHDGAEATRLQKIAFIGADQDALNLLRVCWHDKGYNCAECEKCLRTMASLRALGLKAPTFPDVSDEFVTSKIAPIKLYEEYVEAYWHENLRAAQDRGDTHLVKAITKILKRVENRQLFRLVDKAIFAGALVGLKKKLRP